MRLRLAAALLLCLAGSANAGEAVKTILQNRIAVVVKPEPSAKVVTLSAFVRVGGEQEPAGLRGLSTVVANALVDSSGSEDRARLRGIIEQAGGAVAVQWQPDFTKISLSVTPETFFAALALLSDVLKNSTFSSEAVERAKQFTIGEIDASINGSVFRAAYADIMPILYPGHAYAHPYGGAPAEIAKVTAADVKRFYDTHYTPANIVVVAVGAVQTRPTVDQFERMLSGFERSGNRAAAAEAAPAFKPRVNERTVASSSAYVLVGFRVPGAGSDQYPTVMVLNALLGQGKASRMFSRIRDEAGIGYEVGTTLLPMRSSSQLMGFVQFLPSRAGETGKTVTTEAVRKLAVAVMTSVVTEPPTPEEMVRAQRLAIGAYEVQRQRVRERARWFGFWEMMGQGYLMADELPERIEAVTRDQVVALAREFLKDPVVSVTAPASSRTEKIETGR